MRPKWVWRPAAPRKTRHVGSVVAIEVSRCNEMCGRWRWEKWVIESMPVEVPARTGNELLYLALPWRGGTPHPLWQMRNRAAFTSRHNCFHHVSMYIGEAKIPAGVAIGELLVVEAEERED